MTNHFAKRASHAIFGDSPVKLTNLKITPKLGILVGVTLLGLCTAAALAGYLMQREMLNARIDQTKAIVSLLLDPGGPDQLLPQHQLFLQECVELFRCA